jgi:prephenate dehydratase
MKRKRIVFQGERGAFSELAANQALGNHILAVGVPSFESVFDAVDNGKASLGIIPVENSLIGSIHKNYDLLLERDLYVVGETYFRISLSLIVPESTRLKDVRQVYSHPAALEQCAGFFRDHPQLEPVPFYDTGGAVKMLFEDHPPSSAAIAHPRAASEYGLKTARGSIEDEKANYTRFLFLGRKPVKFKGPSKTSVVFSMKNQPGVLFKTLSVFALRDIDLTKIESRPVRKRAWQYYFYLDFIGSVRDEHVKNALKHLEEITHFVKVLGSYPMANP